MSKRRKTAAFTMVELMVAVVIAIVVTWGIYEMYYTYVRAFVAQDRVLETQQAARIAIDTITQDLIRAGYKVPGGAPAITYASSNQIEMQVFNETLGVQERIRYSLDLQNRLVRNVFRDTGTFTLEPSVSGVLVENVMPSPTQPAVLFQYYTSAAFSVSATNPTALNVATPKDVANAGDVATLNDVRQVKVTLTVRSSKQDPVRKDWVYRTLRADVKPRNAGLMSTTLDMTPPAVPTGLASVDRGDCGTLYLSWNANTEPDLAGYTLHWGYANGEWTDSVNVGKGISFSPASPYGVSNLTDATSYWFAISAFDYSGNSSALSPAINGNSGTVDTTPNIANPDSAPANLAATTGDGYINVTFDRLNEPDVIGYRVYAKPTAFTDADLNTLSTSNGASLPVGTRVVANQTQFQPADPARVTTSASGFIVKDDNSTLIQGCTDNYYAVTAIKGCASATRGTDAVAPNPAYAPALWSRLGPKQASDTQPPVPPASPAMLTAFPSYLRNYLNLTPPSSADLANIDYRYAMVAYRTDGSFPSFTYNPVTKLVTSNGTPVECYPTSYGEGTFLGTGSTINILHRGVPCTGGYHLNPAVTYYYAAVAVDSCGNRSDPATTSAQVAATQCADETEGPAVGNPPKVQGIHGNTVRSVGAVTTSEARLDWTGIDDSFNAIRDLAGYYVFKTANTAGSATPPATPVLGNIDDVKGLIMSPTVTYAGLTEGTVEKFRILSIDCETVTKDNPAHAFLAGRYSSSEFENRASETLILYPGTVDLLAAPTRYFGSGGNVVQFQTKNTMNALATPGSSDRVELQSLKFDWTTLNGGSGSDRRLKSVAITSGTLSFTITPSSPVSSGTLISATGTGFKAGSTNATFQLTFVNATDGTDKNANMKKLKIATTVTYVPVTRLNSDTVTPFVFDATQVATVQFVVVGANGPAVTEMWDSDSTACCWYPAVVYPNPGTLYPSLETMDFLVNVTDGDGVGINRIRIWYATTSKSQTTPPAVGNTLPGSLAGYSAAVICDSDVATPAGACAGSGYYGVLALLAPHTNQRTWYLAVVEDNNGNFDVSPPQKTGSGGDVTYTYDQ